MTHSKKNIYLSGFMGAGKTAVGQELSRLLHRPFIDLDSEIEKILKMGLEACFKRKGEAYFRGIETSLLRQYSQKKSLVVSLGGGAILSWENRVILGQGIWVNLNTPYPLIYQRIGQKEGRPLLKKYSSQEKLVSLLKQREPYYRLAPYQIYAESQYPLALAKKLSRVIQQRAHL